MRFLFINLLSIISVLQAPVSVWGHKPKCLSKYEATDISDRWLHIWWTGAITKRSQLQSIVTEDVASYDEAFGGPTLTLDELFGIVSGTGPSKVTDVTQKRLFFIHSCEDIAVRWEYKGITTGLNSLVAPWRTL